MRILSRYASLAIVMICHGPAAPKPAPRRAFQPSPEQRAAAAEALAAKRQAKQGRRRKRNLALVAAGGMLGA